MPCCSYSPSLFSHNFLFRSTIDIMFHKRLSVAKNFGEILREIPLKLFILIFLRASLKKGEKNKI